MKVSVIMPSNRPDFLPRAIEIFRSQDWEDKELIIIPTEYNTRRCGHLAVPEPNIKLFAVPPDCTIGERRNLACDWAEGEVIIHFDDDDWYAPNYITKSVEHLKATGADATGLSSAFFYLAPKGLGPESPHAESAWEYSYTGSQPYVIGSGMCYYKRIWEQNDFKCINEGEDAAFCANAGRVIPHSYKEGMVAMIHARNTASHKQLRHMKQIDPNIVRNILEKW